MERTASFGYYLWRLPVGHVWLRVEERGAEKDGMESGEPRHKENKLSLKGLPFILGDPTA